MQTLSGYFLKTLKILKIIYNDHVGADDMSKEEFTKLCTTAWGRPHGFVVIDLTSKTNNGKYRCGLDTFYISA